MVISLLCKLGDRVIVARAVCLAARAMTSAGILSGFSIHNMETLLKYRSRRFKYVSCHDRQDVSMPCSMMTRSITDTIGIWWDCKQTMEVKSSPADIFQHFSVLNGHWTLGGPVCRRPDALMLPDVRIVDDDSYVHSACEHSEILTGLTPVLCIMGTDSWEASLPMCSPSEEFEG